MLVPVIAAVIKRFVIQQPSRDGDKNFTYSLGWWKLASRQRKCTEWMRTQWCLELNYCLFVSNVVLVFAFLSQDKYLASTQPKAKILPGGGYETPFDSSTHLDMLFWSAPCRFHFMLFIDSTEFRTTRNQHSSSAPSCFTEEPEVVKKKSL